MSISDINPVGSSQSFVLIKLNNDKFRDIFGDGWRKKLPFQIDDSFQIEVIPFKLKMIPFAVNNTKLGNDITFANFLVGISHIFYSV